MNKQRAAAGEMEMAVSARARNAQPLGRQAVAVSAIALIATGLALQWIEMVWLRFVGQNAWFLSTLMAEAWNMAGVWLGSSSWHQDFRYWPLLLVAIGVAILLSADSVADRSAVRVGARQDG